MTTVADILLHKTNFNINNIVFDVLDTYHIPNTHRNIVTIKQRLQGIIQKHGLPFDDSVSFNAAQKSTFIREIKPIIDKFNWSNSSTNNVIEYRIKHLGENLSQPRYTLEDLTDYIFNELDLPHNQKTEYAISKQIARIMNAYNMKTATITTGMAYSVIDAIKPFLRDHTNVKIKSLVKYNFSSVFERLAKENHFGKTAMFRSALVEESNHRFAHMQKNRYKNGDPVHTSYFTSDELVKLQQWAKDYKNNTVVDDNPLKIIQADNINQDANIMVDDELLEVVPADNTKQDECVEDDMEIKSEKISATTDTTPDSFASPDVQQTASAEYIPNEPKWQTEDTSVLIANPFKIDDQIKILTKRFLLDQYKIDIQSWKADQEALKALDYRSEAYANLYMRLLHPEISYVTKR